MMGPFVVHGVFDEAGDTGIGPRSSRYLVVAGIVCSNLEPLRKAVVRTRKSLGKELRAMPELKARHTPASVTSKLLIRIAALEVEIYVAVLDKQSTRLPNDPEDWYRRVCDEAIGQVVAVHPQASIIIDNRYTKPLLRDRLSEFILTRAQRPGTALALMVADSQQEPALQAADAVAWGVFQKYERNKTEFFHLFGERVTEEVLLLR